MDETIGGHAVLRGGSMSDLPSLIAVFYPPKARKKTSEMILCKVKGLFIQDPQFDFCVIGSSLLYLQRASGQRVVQINCLLDLGG